MDKIINDSSLNDSSLNDSSLNDSSLNNIKKSLKTVYYSDLIGTPIKDAITGATYPFKVGSKEEKKFFRVIVTSNPYKKKYIYTTPDIHKAFYNSPQSYMEHNKCKLEIEIIKKWEQSQI